MNEKIHTLCLKLSQQLLDKHMQLVTAESCTGGGVAYYLTNLPGSSQWFERGFVTYSNQAKSDCLAISEKLLTQFGAVSEETAQAMAEGALHNSQAHVSLAVTGIAGPGGGTSQKPVGTVWVAFASRSRKTHSFLCQLSGSRIEIREQTILSALEHLLEYLHT